MVRDQTVAIINMRGYSHMGLRSDSDVQKKEGRKEGPNAVFISIMDGARRFRPPPQGRYSHYDHWPMFMRSTNQLYTDIGFNFPDCKVLLRVSACPSD